MKDSTKSVVVITSKLARNKNIGSGFVIYHDKKTSFILTCAHVIKDLGGKNNILVSGKSVKVVSKDLNNPYDLAVIAVKNMDLTHPLLLSGKGKKEKRVLISGYSQLSPGEDKYAMRSLSAVLGTNITLVESGDYTAVSAWDILVKDEISTLKPGYSGSPVIDESTGEVLAVASHHVINGKKGLAISIEGVAHIWPDAPKDLIKEEVPPITNIANSEYEYDFVISYDEGFSGKWFREYFEDLFSWAFTDQVGAKPKIAIFRQTDKLVLPVEWKLILSQSKYLIPLWSPSYFEYEWSWYESSVMITREKEATENNPDIDFRLIFPVLVSDGKSFHNFTKEYSKFICRRFVNPTQSFGNSEAYPEFRNDMLAWISSAILPNLNAPERGPDWHNMKVAQLEPNVPLSIDLPKMV